MAMELVSWARRGNGVCVFFSRVIVIELLEGCGHLHGWVLLSVGYACEHVVADLNRFVF